MLKQGYIQIYTGDGKGKTTASLGITLRILANGGNVFYAQFIKGKTISSEFTALRKFGEAFTHRVYGSGRFIRSAPAPEERKTATRGLSECTKALSSGNYSLVVMDELNCAITCGLLEISDVLESIQKRHPRTELLITGRNAPEELINAADLVSEIRPVKHYYEQGVKARKGIEF